MEVLYNEKEFTPIICGSWRYDIIRLFTTKPIDEEAESDGVTYPFTAGEARTHKLLGRDTTKVQFNYYHNGIGGHEYLYNLGFDSSLEYHDYGFKWDEDKITWFVDFEPVYQVRAGLHQWGLFYINVWAGNNNATKNWLGPYEKDNETHHIL